MEEIKKQCTKCGKIIMVSSSEYCCPLCGEFFTDMDNAKVLQHHRDLELSEEIEKLKRWNKLDRTTANKKAMLTWLKVFGVACLAEMFLTFVAIGADVFIKIVVGAWAAVLLVVPVIPIVNYFKYKKILKGKIEALRQKYLEE